MSTSCVCQADITGEDIDINPGCPEHGTAAAHDVLAVSVEDAWEEPPFEQYPAIPGQLTVYDCISDDAQRGP